MTDIDFREQFLAAHRQKMASWFIEALTFGYFDIGAKVQIFRAPDAGAYRYAVAVADNPLFWLDSFSTKKQAVDFAKKMGFEIIV